MNEIKEEIKDKIKEADEKPDLHLVKLGNIKYISTDRGVEILKQFQDMFDLMDRYEKQRQEFCKDESQNAENRIQVTAETKDLTFIDGVLVTWDIFNKILDKRLRDENGNPEKGICRGYSCDYLGIINDDVADLLLNKVLEHGYLKQRGEYLSNQFGVNIG